MIDQLKYLEFFVSVYQKIETNQHNIVSTAEVDSYFCTPPAVADCITLHDIFDGQQSIIGGLSKENKEGKSFGDFINHIAAFIDKNSSEFNTQEMKKRTIVNYVYNMV